MRKLTPEAQAQRDEWIKLFGDGWCECTEARGECDCCAHDGNPETQEADEFAWLPEVDTLPARIKPTINVIDWAPGMEIREGIYRGMPEEVYFGTHAASISGLKEFSVAEARYKFGERETKPAQSIGKLWHTGLLEANELTLRFMPTEVERRGTNAWKLDEALAAGRELIKQEDWDEMEAMRDSVREQGGPLIACLDHPDLEVELSFFWWDYPSGVFCRGRADIAILEHGILADVKSCNEAGEDFKLSVRDWLYHWQDSFYRRGMRRLGIEIGQFPFFAIEKKKPFLYKPWLMPENAIRHADKTITRLLMEYRACLDSGKWRGYSMEMDTIEFPDSWLRIYG